MFYYVDDLRKILESFDGREDIILSVNDEECYIIYDVIHEGDECRIKLISTIDYYES